MGIDKIIKIIYKLSYCLGRISKRYRLFYYKKFEDASPWGVVKWIEDNDDNMYTNNDSALTQKDFDDFLKSIYKS